MINITIARKYAKALLGIGVQERNFEDLGKELEKVAALLQEHKELKSILQSPFYPPPKRKAIAQTITESLGLSKTTGDFIDLLIDRDRMDHFHEIVKAYGGFCDVLANRLRASLICPGNLSPELLQEIKGNLESTTGKEVILSLEEDPSLIGGVITKIGNIIYDGSLKTQLLKATEKLCKE